MSSVHLPGGQFFGRIAERQRAAGVELSEVVHQVPRALPRHQHERTYIGLLLGGAYGEEVGRRPVRHGRLSVSLRPAGVEHRDWIGRSGGRFFMVELASEWLTATQGGTNRLLDPATLPDGDALWTMLRLYREFRQWDCCSPAVVEGLAAALVEVAWPRSEAELRRRPAWLSRAFEAVHDRFREPLRLADLANDAGVHPAHLSRAFRRFYGATPGELARELRVRRACERLGDGGDSLAAVALDAGFADQAHMTRVIGRHVGLTPRRLRELLRTS